MISKDKQLMIHYFLMISVSYKDYKEPIGIYDLGLFTLAKRIIIAFDEVIVSSFYENLE